MPAARRDRDGAGFLRLQATASTTSPTPIRVRVAGSGTSSLGKSPVEVKSAALDALVNVKPNTLIRWHRKGFRLFWRWKSKPTGRPRLPKNLRQLIREMAAENLTWGEERIANELKLKLGIRVSPRTVEKYLRNGGPVRTPDPKQRWLTFVHNHAKVIVACDFFVVVTATFRTLYVFVILELGTRRILHHNVTAHPTAEWTLQQFREALPATIRIDL